MKVVQSKRLLTKVALMLGAAFITFNVTACNTTEGAGKDMQRAGEKIQDSADRNK